MNYPKIVSHYATAKDGGSQIMKMSDGTQYIRRIDDNCWYLRLGLDSLYLKKKGETPKIEGEFAEYLENNYKQFLVYK